MPKCGLASLLSALVFAHFLSTDTNIKSIQSCFTITNIYFCPFSVSYCYFLSESNNPWLSFKTSYASAPFPTQTLCMLSYTAVPRVICRLLSLSLSNRYQLCPGKRSDRGLAHRLQQRWLLQVVGVPQSRGDAEEQHLQVGKKRKKKKTSLCLDVKNNLTAILLY